MGHSVGQLQSKSCCQYLPESWKVWGHWDSEVTEHKLLSASCRVMLACLQNCKMTAHLAKCLYSTAGTTELLSFWVSFLATNKDILPQFLILNQNHKNSEILIYVHDIRTKTMHRLHIFPVLCVWQNYLCWRRPWNWIARKGWNSNSFLIVTEEFLEVAKYSFSGSKKLKDWFSS